MIVDRETRIAIESLRGQIAGLGVGVRGPAGATGAAGTTLWAGITDKPAYATQAATASLPGYLLAADFTTFAAKQAAITTGTTAQYLKGDLSLGTLNQAAVAGLTTADSPVFANMYSSGVVGVGITSSLAGQLDVRPSATGTVGLHIKLLSGHTAAAIDVRDSANASKFSVAANGGMSASGSVVLNTTTAAFYFGGSATDGTWRFVRSGNAFNIDRRETGAFATKATVTEAGSINGTQAAVQAIKTDLVTPTDLTITTGAGKTAVFATPTYQDVNTSIIPRTTGTGTPAYATITGNLKGYQFAVDDYVDCFPAELLHDWKEGTAVEFHCHWLTGGLNDGTVRGVKWEVEYAWANTSGVLSAATAVSVETSIAANAAALTHKYTSVASFTPTGGLIGAQIVFRIKRIASVTNTAPAANPFLLSVGIHYQQDTLGSRTQGAK